MFAGLYRRLCTWAKDYKYRGVVLVVIVVLILSIIVMLQDYNATKDGADSIKRNTYGGGNKTEERIVEIEGERIDNPIEIIVGEQQYTEKEMQEVFAKAIKDLDTIILKQNKSMDEVRSDLDFVTMIPDSPIAVTWEVDRYDIIDLQGQLQQENLKKALEENPEGILVNLKAYLRYTEDETKEALYESVIRVLPKLQSEQEEIATEILSDIQENDNQNKSKEMIKFPSVIQGKNVNYKKPMDNRGFILLVLGLTAAGLMICRYKQNERQAVEKRKMQMLRDYPEIVNKLRLLLGAGMTVKSAWNKIAMDYERQRLEKGERSAYEEMLTTCREMQSGVTESESYERFGRRCGVSEYTKLGALLSQNLRRGTKGLTDLLQMEAIRAFEERKALAKRQGEEAGTKLLIPMFFMLGIVLVIVVVPAFLSIQI